MFKCLFNSRDVFFRLSQVILKRRFQLVVRGFLDQFRNRFGETALRIVNIFKLLDYQRSNRVDR
jgi:hypothetical protein